MKHLLCVHQALLKFRFLGRRGLLGHFCDLIPRLGWSAMERWPRARLSWEWIWWEPLLSEPSTVFPTASLNRFTCSFPGSILATNLLFCPVGANIFWKITKPSNIGFLVLFFFPKRVEVNILLPYTKDFTCVAATPVTSRKIRDPHSFSGADVSQQLSSDVTRMKWKALRNYYINF